MTGYVHIYAPKPTKVARNVEHCDTCGVRRRTVSLYTPYHGHETICCACGSSWGEAASSPPFERGWRKRSVARARRIWKTLVAR